MKSIRTLFLTLIRKLCMAHSDLDDVVTRRTEELREVNERLRQELAERHRAQEKLRLSEEYNRRIVETANEGIWIMDAQHFTTFVNRKMAGMLGYAPEEMLGKQVEFFMCSEQIEDHMKKMEKRHMGEPDQYERCFRHKDGTSVWTLVSGTPLLDEAGIFRGSFGMFADVTQRRKAEEGLRAALSQMENIIEFLPDATFIIDRDRRIIAWNRAIEDMTGVRKEDILGKDHIFSTIPFYGETRPYLMDLVDRDDDEIASKYSFVRRKGDGLYAETFAPALYGGRGAHIWAIASRLYDSQGNVIGVIESIRDITDQKLAQDSLKNSEERYKSLFENAIEGIFQTTLDGRLIMLNASLARMLGYESPGHMMEAVTDIASQVYVNPQDRREIIDLLNHDGKVLGREVLFKGSDGRHIRVILNVVLVKDSQGRGSYIEGSSIDITEKWQAEEDLKASEEKYRTIFENATEGIFQSTPDGRYLNVNPAFARMSGFSSPQEMIDTVKDIGQEHYVNPGDRQNLVRMLRENDRVEGYEVEVLRKDRSRFWISINVHVVRDAAGKVLYLEGTNTDITARKQAEEALKESERHLADIIEFLPDATLVIDREGKVTAWNKAMERMTGVAAADMIGMGSYEYSIPFYGERRPILIDLVLLPREEVEKKYYHIRRRGDLLIGETDAPVVNGEKRFLSGWAHPIYDVSGEIVGAIECIRDITDKRRAEEALQQNEARYRLLAENASDIIFTLDNNLRFTYISPSVERIRGYTVEEAMKQKIEEVLTPKSMDLAIKVFSEEMEKEKAEDVDLWRKRTLELEELCRDGSTIWTETTFTTLRDKEKRLSGLLGITRDISERKKAALEKSRLEAQLSQAQKMESIGTLAGGIAHDFNNILAAIIGYSELALDDILSPEKARAEIGEVIKAGDRARNLVSQILTFSRKADMAYSPLALRTIVKESLKMLRSVIPSTIEIRQDLADSGLIMSDPTQINQILLNLCTNAAHAMEEQGGVLGLKLNRVSISEDAAAAMGVIPGPYLRLTVGDTGHGMPPEVVEKIFEPYFTTKEIGRGTGLGLSVVHGIVKSHSGAIICRSTPGEGTTFEVYLPEVESPQVGLERQPRESYRKGTERILFVDDEPSLVNLAEKMLGKMGYKVTSRSDSREALALFRKNPEGFDLVITDMTMPGLTGDMLAMKIMEIRDSIPVILCTGFSERITEEKVKKMGVRAFVMKPFEMRDLARTIRTVLDSSG